jgi:hypothetical protein
MKQDAELDAAGRPRSVFARLGAANDDEDEAGGHRPSLHVYDYAPPPPDDADEDDEEEDSALFDEEEEEIARLCLDRLARAQLAAFEAGEEIPDTAATLAALVDAERARRAAPGEASLPPGVASTSSTSAAPREAAAKDSEADPAHPQLPPDGRLAGESPSPIASP